MQVLAIAASQVAREVDAALLVLVVASLVLLLGTTGTVIAFVIRYRRSRTSQVSLVHGHTALEVTWTVLPTILVLGLFYSGFKPFLVMRKPPADAMEVQVLAQQWFWTFTYPEAGVSSPELVIPVNSPVVLRMTAPETDVVHSLYIPALRIKEDVVPGRQTYTWLTVEETGVYNIFCAEYCGKDHARMISRLHVVTQAEFKDWLKAQVAERFQPVDAAQAMDAKAEVLKGTDGARLYRTYCASCHGANGEGGGPYKARDLRTSVGWKRSPKKTDIFATISLGLDGTQMRPFRHLPVRERLALMNYVAGFNPGSPPVTPSDIAAMKQRFPETDPATYKAPPLLEPAMPIEEAMKQVVEAWRPTR